MEQLLSPLSSRKPARSSGATLYSAVEGQIFSWHAIDDRGQRVVAQCVPERKTDKDIRLIKPGGSVTAAGIYEPCSREDDIVTMHRPGARGAISWRRHKGKRFACPATIISTASGGAQGRPRHQILQEIQR